MNCSVYIKRVIKREYLLNKAYIDGHPVEVRGGGCGRRAGVGNGVSAGLCDVNICAGDFKSFTGHLHNTKHSNQQEL